MTKLRTIVFSVITLLLSFTAMAQPKILTKGELFLDVRKSIIKQHWTPTKASLTENYEYLGIEKELIAAGIVEVENCVIDRAICIFNYKKNRQCLRIFTEGEDISMLKVIGWNKDCP